MRDVLMERAKRKKEVEEISFTNLSKKKQKKEGILRTGDVFKMRFSV